MFGIVASLLAKYGAQAIIMLISAFVEHMASVDSQLVFWGILSAFGPLCTIFEAMNCQYNRVDEIMASDRVYLGQLLDLIKDSKSLELRTVASVIKVIMDGRYPSCCKGQVYETWCIVYGMHRNRLVKRGCDMLVGCDDVNRGEVLALCDKVASVEYYPLVLHVRTVLEIK
jgi:hypothetical protein